MAYNVVVEAQHDCDDTLAKNVAEVLVHAYPGHPWHINVTGGCVVIKHMLVSPKWGMVRHYKDLIHDAAVLKREILFAGGEFLERAGLTRGAATGERIQIVEGIPAKDLRH